MIMCIYEANQERRVEIELTNERKKIVKSGVRTHALFRGVELKSTALDRSAILTPHKMAPCFSLDTLPQSPIAPD